MDWSRSPAVAGLFYPDEPEALAREVEGLLRAEAGMAHARKDLEADPSSTENPPKALVVPHAGYVYSGPVAASAYRRLLPFRESISRVVLLGPAHRWAFRGLAGSSATSFQTPLGVVPLDRETLDAARDLPQFHVLDQAHEGEHSLEVHLPFLQVVLGDFHLVPIVVGDVSPEEVAAVLDALWGGEETLVVVSSDLSHYLPYSRAVDMDEATARAIEELRPEELRQEQACGRIPLAGLLLRARAEGLKAETLDLRNSGDTAGPRDRVVGYGSFLFA